MEGPTRHRAALAKSGFLGSGPPPVLGAGPPISAQAAPALRALVADLAREGRAKAEIVKLLDNDMVQQRTAADFREEDEETVLEVLDALRGWCHPTAELLPEKPVR